MAHTCVRGADLMYKYCEEHDLPVERCGKLVVACNEKEHEQVEKLYRQGTANGVKGLKIINSKEVTYQELFHLIKVHDLMANFRLRNWNPTSGHTVLFTHLILALSITGLSVNALQMNFENQGKISKDRLTSKVA